MDSLLFLGFSLDAWITIVTVLGMFSVLLFTKLRSDLVFLGAIAILFVTGVLDVLSFLRRWIYRTIFFVLIFFI